MLRILDGSADTIKELKKLINDIPDDYAVSLSGMNTFGVVVDDENKTILLDDVSFVENLMEEQRESVCQHPDFLAGQGVPNCDVNNCLTCDYAKKCE